MNKALFSGSFDPLTVGHLDVIVRGASLFDHLIVAVAEKSDRRSFLYSLEDRKARVVEAVKSLPNVEVVTLKGLVVDLAKEKGVTVLLRGLRSCGSADFDYEYQMAASNRQLSGIETLFLFSSPKYSHISGTLVREIASSNFSLKGFIP